MNEITKIIVGNELYVYIKNNGKKDLLYKRWLNKGYGMIFCNQWGSRSFTAKDVDSLKTKNK